MPLTSMPQAMTEFKSGALHSGKGGPVVTNKRQAVAIGLSAQRRAKGKSSMKGSK